MHNTITNRISLQPKLHFKQWSHKSYAVFCSMGKVVHIGNLAVSLTQWIGNIIEYVEDQMSISIACEVDEEVKELLEQEMLQVIPVVNAQEECGIRIYYSFKILIAVNWRYSPLSGFFMRYGKGY
jgi:hypothetical protein